MSPDKIKKAVVWLKGNTETFGKPADEKGKWGAWGQMNVNAECKEGPFFPGRWWFVYFGANFLKEGILSFPLCGPML